MPVIEIYGLLSLLKLNPSLLQSSPPPPHKNIFPSGFRRDFAFDKRLKNNKAETEECAVQRAVNP